MRGGVGDPGLHQFGRRTLGAFTAAHLQPLGTPQLCSARSLRDPKTFGHPTLRQRAQLLDQVRDIRRPVAVAVAVRGVGQHRHDGHRLDRGARGGRVPVTLALIPRHREADLARRDIPRRQGQRQREGAALAVADVEGHRFFGVGGDIDHAAVDLCRGVRDGMHDRVGKGRDDPVEVSDGDLDQHRGARRDGEVARSQLQGHRQAPAGAPRSGSAAHDGADQALGFGAGRLQDRGDGARRAPCVEQRAGDRGNLEGRFGQCARRNQDSGEDGDASGDHVFASSGWASRALRGSPRYTSRWVINGR